MSRPLSPRERNEIMKRRAAWIKFHAPDHLPPTETGRELYYQANELLRLAYDPHIEKRRGKYFEYQRILKDVVLRELWLSKFAAYRRRVQERLKSWHSRQSSSA